MSESNISANAQKIITRLEELHKERNDIIVHLNMNEGAILENRKLLQAEQKPNTKSVKKQKKTQKVAE